MTGKFDQRSSSVWIILLFLLGLTACGSGGASPDPVTESPPPPPGPPPGPPPPPAAAVPPASSAAISTPPAAPAISPFRKLPDARSPGVAALTPGQGASGVDPLSQIRVTFDKPIDRSTLTPAAFILTAPDRAQVAGSISYDPGEQTARFIPDRPLAPATTYQGTLNRKIKDVFGNFLSLDYSWRFTTAGDEAAQRPVCPERARPPYVAFATPTSATLAWECGPEGTVEWGIAPSLTFRFEERAGWRKHFVTLSDLLSDTLYLYRVRVGGRTLGEGSFRTAKGAGDNHFNFVAFADSGVDSTDQLALAALMERLDFSFALMPGDVVYEEGYDPEFDPRYFEPYRNLIGRLPFFAVAGDHDLVANGNGETFMSNFFHPTGKLYYDFRWGDAHFFALDSTLTWFHSFDPNQLAWFQRAISESAARWKIVYFHHPPYNSGLFGNIPNMKAFLPLFDQYHVDVVFTGHAHHYERTVPINGVTYFVTGGGGAFLTRRPTGGAFTARAESAHHLILAGMTPDALTLQAIDTNGAVFDSVTIRK